MNDDDQPTLFGEPPIRSEAADSPTGNAVRWLESLGWTLHRPGESCVEVSHAFKGKRDTSGDAALAVEPRTGTQRARVLALIRSWPATDPEIQAELNMGPNTERPRRVELVTGKLVRDSGQRRTHRGREHIVWEAVPKTEETLTWRS